MIRVLIPLDGSQLAEEAIGHAIAIADSFKTEIHLLQVVGTAGESPAATSGDADLRMQVAQAKSYLSRKQAEAMSQGATVHFHVAQGRAAEQIIQFAQNNEIDLIALTAYGRGGISDFVSGSTVHKVLSRAGVSILLLRPTAQIHSDVHYRKLLVPLDGSFRTDWALFLATSIARAHQAELILMQVVQTAKASKQVPASHAESELIERLLEIQKHDASHHLAMLEERLPKDIKRSSRVVVAEEASQVINEIAQSEDVGLLVLTAHGMSDADCWVYGPVSETLLAHSTHPVLVLQDSLSSRQIEFEPRTEPIVANG